jgi:bisphosphoglycerate-independent phosphoglycerate mutase (AlkP superfamily)
MKGCFEVIVMNCANAGNGKAATMVDPATNALPTDHTLNPVPSMLLANDKSASAAERRIERCRAPSRLDIFYALSRPLKARANRC